MILKMIENQIAMEEEKKFEIGNSDLKELEQVVFEVNIVFQSKTWEILEGLGQELQIRGKTIELFSRYKRLRDEARNN